ncbi:MAG TPA: hypothetical protein VHE35_16005 [Kofleriaceae bacterium]|nr:hypothetical protein [Kofleriaceae bacterium]
MVVSKTTIAILASLSSLVLACTPPPGGRPPPGMGAAGGPPPPNAGAGACDPAQCSNFCYYASGCITSEPVTSDECERRCKSLCGNTFFDDRDASLMSCVIGQASVDLACRPMHDCCAKDFTSELCKEVPAETGGDE